ncbi:MAG: alpha/beta hydrolase [Betaproteobacteria bacterium]|nr:alpha/beta hydrolase [Betaproteobacteria bacterium]
MAIASFSPDLQMHYEVDDFAEPWREHETVLLLHGNAESGEVWYGWVPHLAAELRVVRPDMRGFGRSTPMPRDYPWSPSRIADDYLALMDRLGVERFHLVGAKVGGTMALRFAARHSSRVQTLTVLAPPVRAADSAARYVSWVADIERNGVEAWARATMSGRLGPDFPAEGSEWWIKLMGRTPLSTQLGFLAAVPKVDVTPDLPAIRCPTMVITTGDNPLYPLATVQAWQRQIPDSRLLTVPGNSYHIAATAAAQCARATLEFIRSGPKRRDP